MNVCMLHVRICIYIYDICIYVCIHACGFLKLECAL